MTASTVPALIAHLLELVRSERPMPCTCMRALQAERVRNYQLQSGFFVIPLVGTSRISDSHGSVDVRPGELLVVPNARAIDWEQFPDDEGNEYASIGVALDAQLVAAARQLLPETTHVDAGPIQAVSLTTLQQPLARWRDVMAEGNRALAFHAIAEIVIRLVDAGHTGLMRVAAPSIAAQICAMVATEPERDWQSADFEERLHMSGPTLRRRLAADGSSLRNVLAEARVSHGLHLLLTTRLPVKSVAVRAGYHSAASFSKRLRCATASNRRTSGARRVQAERLA